MKRQQSGFTIVELVVVILIISILGATALPRFMNVTSDAHRAAVAGASGGFGAGIALVHAQWVANGGTAATTDVNNFGSDDVDVSADGWPVSVAADSATLTTADECVEVWNGVMQNPPTVATGGTTTDYTVAVAGGVCTYTYRLDSATSRTIAYDSGNGSLTVTNPDT